MASKLLEKFGQKIRDERLRQGPSQEALAECERLLVSGASRSPHVRVVTDLRAESVLGGSLDMDALQIFQNNLNRFELVTLPHLHAKVYIFDNSFAVVGSANLTRSGLDSNYEYSVGVHDKQLVSRIRADMESYARLGSLVNRERLSELSQIAEELKREFIAAQKSITVGAKRRFNERLKVANLEFIQAQVGNRTAHAVFAEAILYLLYLQGTLSTKRMQPMVQQLLPDLCDDSRELIINGHEYGKAWKHQVRTSQVYLKRKGLIVLENNLWRLSS